MKKLLLLAPVLLLASCHSEQVVLQSQATVSEPLVATAPAAPSDAALTATVVAQRPEAAAGLAAPAAAPPTAAKPQLPPIRPPRHADGRPSLSKLAAATIARPMTRHLAHRWQRQRPTEGVAESGLGGIGLFFIGVVLAVLVGLGALVSLIPGVSLWGGLGLAAAGLVVLFLLYSLLSGGKKKK